MELKEQLVKDKIATCQNVDLLMSDMMINNFASDIEADLKSKKPEVYGDIILLFMLIGIILNIIRITMDCTKKHETVYKAMQGTDMPLFFNIACKKCVRKHMKDINYDYSEVMAAIKRRFKQSSLSQVTYMRELVG